MSEAINAFQNLDSNSKISLIIRKAKLSYILKKSMFMFAKYPYGNSPRWEISRGHLSWGSIILGENRWELSGINCPGGNCSVPLITYLLISMTSA